MFVKTNSIHFFTLIVNGSAELRRVEVALVLGEEEEHEFQYLPGESDNTVWPGNHIYIVKLRRSSKNNLRIILYHCKSCMGAIVKSVGL